MTKKKRKLSDRQRRRRKRLFFLLADIILIAAFLACLRFVPNPLQIEVLLLLPIAIFIIAFKWYRKTNYRWKRSDTPEFYRFELVFSALFMLFGFGAFSIMLYAMYMA